MLPLQRLAPAAAVLLAGSTAEAWTISRPFAMGGGRWSSSPSAELSFLQSPLPSPSTALHIRRRRAFLSLVMSSTARHDASESITTAPGQASETNVVGEAPGMPALRTLYDAPPRLSNSENDNRTENSNVDGNLTDSENDNEGWVTEVTSGTLPTEEGSSHVLYYEVHRRVRPNKSGDEADNLHTKVGEKRLTALFLHGGPGAGCFPNHVRFFSPELYETVVLLDQRGCGRSTPLGETRNNTLELLVDDVERLRVHLLGDLECVAKPWDLILGGSWGCTLALAFAHTYPQRVRAMVLRGVCLFRSEEIDWLFGDPPLPEGSSRDGLRTSNLRSLLGGGGAARSTQSFRSGSEPIARTGKPQTQTTKETAPEVKKTASTAFPDAWREFSRLPKPSPSEQRANESSPRRTLRKYYNMLLGSDPTLRFRAVKSWMRWEMGIYSSGFCGGKGRNENNTTLLVWNPATASWHHEDARVADNRSVASIDVAKEVEEETAQSLRRFSSPSELQSGRQTPSEVVNAEPMPVHLATALSTGPTPTQQTSKGNGTNSTFDPTTFVPAQSMLTCYFSANDDFCIGPYRPFLSLTPPSALDPTSWYSSRLPPSSNSIDLQQSTTDRPLPPTIAIQGGNDAICPPDTALDLHGVWKEMELRIALEGGHSMYDPIIAGEIVKATDRFGRSLMDEERPGIVPR